jgi:hypothetical protein
MGHHRLDAEGRIIAEDMQAMQDFSYFCRRNPGIVLG